MAITVQTVGTAVNGSATSAPTIPASNAGDLLLLCIASGNASDAPVTTLVDAVGSWTEIVTGGAVGGSGTYGTDAGNRIAQTFYREATSTDLGSGTVTASNGAASGTTRTTCAVVIRLTKTNAGAWTVAGVGATDTSSGTSYSAAAGSDPGGANGDLAVVTTAWVPDAATASAQALTWTGTGTATTTNRVTNANGQGADVRLIVDTRALTGTSSASPTFSATGSAAVAGASLIARIREPSGGVTGTAAGSFGFTGTASGVPETFGTAAGSFGFTATASGVPETFGTAAASFGYTGTANGVPETFGVAAGSFGFTGTAAGKPFVSGTGLSSFGFTATASGVPETFGTALGSFGFTGTASGVVVGAVTGTAVASFGFTGTVRGRTKLLRGIGISGGEFHAGGNYDATSTFSNANPGTLDTNYHYEGQSSLNFLAGRGWKVVRVTMRWERIQPTISGALSSTEVTRITNLMDRCATAGLKVVLDVHNYGLYYRDVSGTGTRTAIGDTELPFSAFADLWSRMATQFSGHSALYAYGLMNEPQSTGGLTAAEWKDASQDAVEAIRAVDTTHQIIVAGFGQSGTAGWVTNNGSSAWITDSAGKTLYDCHNYWDVNQDGNYAESYAAAVTAAQDAGYTAGSNPDALHTRILTELTTYTNWLNTNGVQGIIGEFGWSNATDTSSWNALADAFLDRLDQLSVGWLAWSTGEFYAVGSDPLLIYEASSGTGFGPLDTVKSQAATLEERLAVLGTAGGSFGFTATASGVPETFGTAAASFGGTFTANGQPFASGTALAAFGFTATASGVDRALGVVVGTFGFTGAISGVAARTGTAVSVFGFTGVVLGVPSAPLFFFTPPTHEEPIRLDVKPLSSFRLTYAPTVLRRNGTFISMRTPPHEWLTEAGVNGVDYFIGGCEYTVTQQVRDALVAAGYTVTEL